MMALTDSLQDLRNYLNDSAAMPADSQLRNYVKTATLGLAGETAPVRATVQQAQAFLGREVGMTNWFPITQNLVNQFASFTGDFQFIHVDQDRAQRETCYAGTIAHGMLTMALMPTFATYGTLKIIGTKQSIIYGLDRVRFLNPVRIGSRIRGRFTLLSAEERNEREVLLRHSVTIELENEPKPALIADWIVVAVR
ncbi:MaoC family dehydratase [Pseudohongiella spirulinae]|nr:MaoC family dehydratase [Pseudohongiella spirulinae]